MFCPNCGTQCHDNHKFCWNCGEPLEALRQEVAAAVFSAETSPEEAFCAEKNCVATQADMCEETDADASIPAVESPSGANEFLTVAEAPAIAELPSDEEPPAIEAVPPIGEFTASQPVFTPASPVKKGRLWPPILFMGIMIAVGLLLFWIIPLGGSTSESETAWFEVEDGTLYFYPEYYTGGSELTIPETVDGQTVTAIAPFCFKGNADITTVHLPETVTAIHEGAFWNCASLRGIYLPEGVTILGANAFASCVALEAIYIPASVGDIGSHAFESCDSLRYIFYSGTSDQWYALYSEEITPETYVEAINGGFIHDPTT